MLLFLAVTASACSSPQYRATTEYTALLKIAPSGVPGAGNGVFATGTIPGGADLGGYEGQYITEAEWLKLAETGKAEYVMSLPDCAYPAIAPYKLIDGRDGSIHSRINYAPPPLQNAEIRFFCDPPYARIVTLRAIETGEELFIDYGPDYDYSFMKNKKVQDYFKRLQRTAKKR
ncbi:MAG: hypothetical protein OHK0011_19600 [Turneriella sp.]